MYRQSILNTSNSKSKIWTKPTLEFEQCDKEITFSTIAYKASSQRKTEFSERFFKIKGNFLFYTKSSNSNSVSGICDLRWATVEFLPLEKEILTCSSMRYTVLIVKNGRFTNIFLENEEDLELWRKALSPVTIMTDLFKRYDVVNQIGLGGFGEVSFIKILIVWIFFLFF